MGWDKKHWQYDMGCRHNPKRSDCVRDSFWKTVIESKYWKAWVEEMPFFDTYECEECGVISSRHFEAFIQFILSKKTQTESAWK